MQKKSKVRLQQNEKNFYNSFLSHFSNGGKRSRALTMLSALYEGMYMKNNLHFGPTSLHFHAKLYNLIDNRTFLKRSGKKLDKIIVPFIIDPEYRISVLVKQLRDGINIYTPASKKRISMSSKLIFDASELLRNENSKSQQHRARVIELAAANRANMGAGITRRADDEDDSSDEEEFYDEDYIEVDAEPESESDEEYTEEDADYNEEDEYEIFSEDFENEFTNRSDETCKENF